MTDDRVDLSELLDAAADNVARDDAADELNHAVGDAADGVDGDHGVGVVAAVVVPFVLGMLADAAVCIGSARVDMCGRTMRTFSRHKPSSCCCIQNDEKCGTEAKDGDGRSKNILGGISLDLLVLRQSPSQQ